MEKKTRVGITGQAGFIGSHLYNYLGLQPGIERIPFQDDYFDNQNKLAEFVGSCDVLVHLAAVNRHAEAQTLYDTNIGLVQQVIDALETVDHKPHVLFSSSIQEQRDNLYGKSKKDGRELFSRWAAKNQALFTGLVIPNVFGPFGQPFYNSVVSTFSHQLIHNEEPQIHIDAELPLVYVNDLVAEIGRIIDQRRVAPEYPIAESARIKVSRILSKLQQFKQIYVENGIFPDLSNRFDLDLFNTFRSYVPVDFFPRIYPLHADERGRFVELVKTDNGGQTSYSTTRPGITRGNHFHIRKVERFMVINGTAEIKLRRIGSDSVITYQLDGRQPAFVDIPVWVTHNLTNVGEDELVTVFWINERFDPEDEDTFYEIV